MAGGEDYLKIREEQEEPTAFADGFGIKAILAGLFVAFVVMPGSMFMFLMLGQQLGQPAVWVTLIVFLEIAKRCRTTLSRQEMFVIYSVTFSVLGAAIPNLWMNTFVGMTYFVRSDAAVQFEIANQIPFWKAPPPGSEAFIQRSLLHRDWWPQLGLLALFTIWGRLSFFSLGYAVFRLTSDVERLPFPMAPIAAKGVTALAESDEETWRWRCFSIGSTVGIVFGLIYVAIPPLSDVFLRKPLYLIPVPFYDFTTKLQNVGWFRAVPLAIGTNLALIFSGFVLPFWMVVGNFCGGVLGRLILNPILYRIGILNMWQPGMDYIETGLANQFDFWLSFSIGTAVAIALLGFYAAFSQAIKAQAARSATSGGSLAPPKGRGDVPIPVAVLFYIAGTLWMIMLCHWLVPKFPVWLLLLFGFVWTPMISYVSARLHGLTGHAVGIPYVREAAFVLSGYKGVDIWYAPVPMGDQGGSALHFREVELTGTRFTSIFKAQLLMAPIAVVAGLLFWSFLYKISDIPEDYPNAMRFWPRDATMTAFWMTATTTGNAFFLKALNWRVIGCGTGYAVAMYTFLRLIGAPTLFLYGTITGLVGDPAWAAPMLAAALLGRFYMQKVFGRQRWGNFTPVLAAGFACGTGLVGMGAVAILLIHRAITMVPF
ncbi:MAG: peptide transporter [Candidatus Brocadiaceae bacterium]|nr:peptide transporter [Candidatus Brocadiaceae bacterium]